MTIAKRDSFRIINLYFCSSLGLAVDNYLQQSHVAQMNIHYQCWIIVRQLIQLGHVYKQFER